MPLLFSILEYYNFLSKQPNYACGLFLYDLMFMVVSWARAIMTISKKAWTFPGRPYYYILYFQKLIENPTTVREKEERDIPGPRDNLEGKNCLAGSPLAPWPCHGLGMSWRLPTLHLYWSSLRSSRRESCSRSDPSSFAWNILLLRSSFGWLLLLSALGSRLQRDFPWWDLNCSISHRALTTI